MQYYKNRMDFTGISYIGWLVILIAIILLFILAWFKGLHISKDGAHTNIDTKLNEYENKRARDENKRIDLWKDITLIDNKEKENIEINIETVRKQFRALIRNQISCGVALNHITDRVLEALNVKVDEDDFRRKLDPNNIEVYKKDVLLAVEYEYDEIKRQMEKTNCNETLFEFAQIKKDVSDIVEAWCENIRSNVVFSCEEKVKTYEQYQDSFVLEAYKTNFVDKPLIKNNIYLERLTTKPKDNRIKK